MKRCNENIKKALTIAEELQKLADKGDISREDDGCGVLLGIIRDSAYKIKAHAEKEMNTHISKGKWE